MEPILVLATTRLRKLPIDYPREWITMKVPHIWAEREAKSKLEDRKH